MPCDSIITQSVSLESITDWDLLRQALDRLQVVRLQVWPKERSAAFDLNGVAYTIANGQLTARAYRGEDTRVGSIADQIKQGYSRAAIYQAAKKNNWLVKETSKNKFEVSRRF